MAIVHSYLDRTRGLILAITEANALAGFIADQFGSLEPDAGPSLPALPAPSVATSTAMLEPLNERPGGVRIVDHRVHMDVYQNLLLSMLVGFCHP